MPRFVVLHHQVPPDHDRPSHWDWMLEQNHSLLTWWTSPIEDFFAGHERERTVTATPLTDHRLDYLDYEGPLSGNRGHVSRLHQGTFVIRQLPSPDRFPGLARTPNDSRATSGYSRDCTSAVHGAEGLLLQVELRFSDCPLQLQVDIFSDHWHLSKTDPRT